MKEKITAWLIEWFEDNTLEERADIAANLSANYFDLGWLDSLRLVQLVEDIEDEYEVEISNDQFQDRAFSSIEGLAGIISNQNVGQTEEQKSEYTKTDIIAALRQLGLQEGSHIFIHSNVGFFGKLTGANTPEEVYSNFKKAIREVIGKTGTVIYPTFSYSFCKGQDFDPSMTESTCGILSEVARQDADSIRSHDANFSIAAQGELAVYFTENPPKNSFGDNCFWERFLEKDGIFVNFNFDSGSTFVHYAERKLNVPYRWDKPFTGNLLVNAHAQESTFYHYVRDLDKPEHAPIFTKLDAAAKAQELNKTVNLGRGQIVCITAKDTFDLIQKEIKNQPDFLIAGKAQ